VNVASFDATQLSTIQVPIFGTKIMPHGKNYVSATLQKIMVLK
jgi:hypothetical protein